MVVTKIVSATLAVRFPLAGVAGVRPSADMTYSLVRLSASYVGDGAEDTFAIGSAVESYETVKVWVNGVLKVLTTDYTIVGSNVVMGGADIPAAGQVVEICCQTNASAIVSAGFDVEFDYAKENSPVWGWLIPAATTVLEVLAP